jgi:hypothetical protein
LLQVVFHVFVASLFEVMRRSYSLLFQSIIGATITIMKLIA